MKWFVIRLVANGDASLSQNIEPKDEADNGGEDDDENIEGSDDEAD